MIKASDLWGAAGAESRETFSALVAALLRAYPILTVPTNIVKKSGPPVDYLVSDTGEEELLNALGLVVSAIECAEHEPDSKPTQSYSKRGRKSTCPPPPEHTPKAEAALTRVLDRKEYIPDRENYPVSLYYVWEELKDKPAFDNWQKKVFRHHKIKDYIEGVSRHSDRRGRMWEKWGAFVKADVGMAILKEHEEML